MDEIWSTETKYLCANSVCEQHRLNSSLGAGAGARGECGGARWTGGTEDNVSYLSGKETSAPIGAWKHNFLFMKLRQTNRPTERGKDGLIGNLHLQWSETDDDVGWHSVLNRYLSVVHSYLTWNTVKKTSTAFHPWIFSAIFF